MLITLIVLWVLITVVFFGSLAFAASQPMPPIDQQALMSDPTMSQDFAGDMHPQPEYACAVAHASSEKFETAVG